MKYSLKYPAEWQPFYVRFFSSLLYWENTIFDSWKNMLMELGGGAGQGPFWGRYGAAYLMKRFDALFGFGAFRSFRVENPRRTTDFHF